MYEDDDDDVFTGTDEDGNKLELAIDRYFFYNGEEYVLLRENNMQDEDMDESGGNPEETTLYVMRVMEKVDETGEETEEFVPVEESLMETLIQVVQTKFAPEDGEITEDLDGN